MIISTVIIDVISGVYVVQQGYTPVPGVPWGYLLLRGPRCLCGVAACAAGKGVAAGEVLGVPADCHRRWPPTLLLFLLLLPLLLWRHCNISHVTVASSTLLLTPQCSLLPCLRATPPPPTHTHTPCTTPQSLDCDGYIAKKQERRLDKSIKYVLVSGKKALADAGLEWMGDDIKVCLCERGWGRGQGVVC